LIKPQRVIKTKKRSKGGEKGCNFFPGERGPRTSSAEKGTTARSDNCAEVKTSSAREGRGSKATATQPPNPKTETGGKGRATRGGTERTLSEEKKNVTKRGGEERRQNHLDAEHGVPIKRKEKKKSRKGGKNNNPLPRNVYMPKSKTRALPRKKSSSTSKGRPKEKDVTKQPLLESPGCIRAKKGNSPEKTGKKTRVIFLRTGS